MAKKVITWYGKTEEDLKDMDMEEFMLFLKSRARRSLKRGVSEKNKKVLEKIKKGENNFKTHCRDIVIVPAMLGKTIRVYNGKEFIPVTITLSMLGHFLGEFSLTRRYVSHSAPGVGATRSSAAVSVK